MQVPSEHRRGVTTGDCHPVIGRATYLRFDAHLPPRDGGTRERVERDAYVESAVFVARSDSGRREADRD